ncbi:MAG TPA: hypothetical protein VLF94_01330 [Chlamydiales bacterium]|nr:hypothetical protein [Chlamydiales bacterium]
MRKKTGGTLMLQDNSFFSRPMTYFGTVQNIEEEEEDEDQEWFFADPWQISFDPRIGIFIHWHDGSG